MRVLVTGGAGFIGSHLADLFNRYNDVAVVDDLSGGYLSNLPYGVEFHRVDITDHQEVDRVFAGFKPDLVVHTAAYAAEGLSHWCRRYCYTQNLVGWANVANAVVDHDVSKVVVLSSMAVYGAQTPPFHERMVPQPVDPYGAAKAAMETDVKALAAVHGVDWLVIRPHNVYGPGQNLADPYRNVVAIFTRQALAGEPITVFGDGSQTRAFSYIGDVAYAIHQLALERSGVTVNVGGNAETTILNLAHLVKTATGSESEIVHLPPRHEVADAWCDHTLLRELLGGWVSTDLDVGVEKMADWARSVTVGVRREYPIETIRNLYAPWS